MFQPGRLIDQHREGRCVALGKGIRTEGAQAVEDILSDDLRDAFRSRPGDEVIMKFVDGGGGVLRTQCPPQQFTLPRRKSGQIACATLSTCS